MADGGFSINISASSAPKPAKKKNTFRAKKNAKRTNAKGGVKARADDAGSKKTTRPGVVANTAAGAKTAKQAERPNGNHARDQKKPIAAVKDKQPAPRAAAVPVVAAEPLVRAKPIANDDDSDDDDDDDDNLPSAAFENAKNDDDDAMDYIRMAINAEKQKEEEDDEVDAKRAAKPAVTSTTSERAPKSEKRAASSSTVTSSTTPASAPAATKRAPASAVSAPEPAPIDLAKKPFGSRKNPNKESYRPEAFTQVRTQIENVLEAPLESSSSEQIFAQSTFASLNVHARLAQVLEKDAANGGFGFARPTRVQVQTVPAVLSGKDVLVKSETGSGKTLSYLLPIVEKLRAIEPRVQRSDGCLALILAPTRELCQQILETANKLIQPFVYLVPGAVVGGEKKKAEKARLRKGICILVATPGRLADHLVNTQCFDYSKLQFLVLDEADRLLDMGFEKQITQILSIIDAKKSTVKRQNVLVSATINSGVQQLAAMSLKNPVRVDADEKAGKSGAGSATSEQDTKEVESFSTPHQLMQHFMIVPAKTRLCALSCFLRNELSADANSKCKIVVFMSTCDAVDFHYALFGKCAWPAGRQSKDANAVADGTTAKASSMFGSAGPVFRLHGNIPQQERTSTFKSFCSASSGVLLCTDVAARGLNLPTVHWIIQYDPPTETRDYVHRVGRTARSGKEGSSLLFLMPSESEYLDYLKKQNLTLNALSLEKTITRVGKRGGFSTSSRKKLFHEVIQSDLQYLFEQTVLADNELFELACQGFHSFVRSYATHSSDTRRIFHVRSLHFGHIAKSFALREPPASNKVRDTGKNAKTGTMHKRKEREDKIRDDEKRKMKMQRFEKRKFQHNVSEFAD